MTHADRRRDLIVHFPPVALSMRRKRHNVVREKISDALDLAEQLADEVMRRYPVAEDSE